MAKQVTNKLFEGGLEVDVLERDEGIGAKRCKKNPGHKHFIPCKDFTINHLPVQYRDVRVYLLIQWLIRLTVMITVGFVSEKRPDFYPGTEQAYPASGKKGKSVNMKGSGKVCKVTKFSEKDNRTCECRSCKNSTEPKKIWGVINIFTATHVVHDDSEVKSSVCTFDFDREGSVVVELQAEALVRASAEKDWCRLSCVTHDVEMLQKLEHALEKFDECCQKVQDIFQPITDEDNLTVIVSHPHGIPKRVSIGEWKVKVRDERCGDHTYSYTTPTCGGSSGAYVYILGGGKQSYDYLHKGCSESNYCTKGWETL
ncbi:uncharacterized protein LOC131943362 [Physella acuta]|uniref:uncharacterized protein LOC131943362 n=1 Tax=Physella acuta TaxID=109671 RepID=UPI0027DACA99|nr:uncharacterized protein LOC131943362 [Physella acuta]